MSKTIVGIIILNVWLFIIPSETKISTPSETVVDLTYLLNRETFHWVTARDFELRIIQNGTVVNGNHSYWLQDEEVHMATHTGTHLDAPCHFSPGKWSVDQIPLKNLIDRPLAVIDIIEKCMDNRDYEMRKNDVIQWERENGQIPSGAVVLVKTGWSRFWPNRLKYFGTETKNASLLHFPGIHPDAAQWLTCRQVVGVGIDALGIDKGQSQDYWSHKIFLSQNIYLLENIAKSIEELPATGARLTLLPIKVERACGTPVRIIAKIGLT